MTVCVCGPSRLPPLRHLTGSHVDQWTDGEVRVPDQPWCGGGGTYSRAICAVRPTPNRHVHGPIDSRNVFHVDQSKSGFAERAGQTSGLSF
eukprot:g24849.t1